MTDTAARAIDNDKAQRIIEAMRVSVAQRGVAGATFDHVAREAGVSRGLLHYYFATKERLLAEVVRRDCDVRLEGLRGQLAAAASADDVIGLLRVALEEYVNDEPESVTMIFELSSLARRNEEIAEEFRTLLTTVRDHVADVLSLKAAEGVISLHGDPAGIADVLFALGDGIALRMLAEPERDWAPTIEAGLTAVRALLTDG